MSDSYQPNVMSCSTLKGDKVKNNEGETLGEITDVMLDVNSGEVAYAVLSFGGFLGLGDKLFAVPWEALRVDTEDECFRLDVDREKLENAPGFDKDHRPVRADRSFIDHVHDYYDLQPYYRRRQDWLAARSRTNGGPQVNV